MISRKTIEKTEKSNSYKNSIVDKYYLFTYRASNIINLT